MQRAQSGRLGNKPELQVKAACHIWNYKSHSMAFQLWLVRSPPCSLTNRLTVDSDSIPHLRIGYTSRGHHVEQNHRKRGFCLIGKTGSGKLSERLACHFRWFLTSAVANGSCMSSLLHDPTRVERDTWLRRGMNAIKQAASFSLSNPPVDTVIKEGAAGEALCGAGVQQSLGDGEECRDARKRYIADERRRKRPSSRITCKPGSTSRTA